MGGIDPTRLINGNFISCVFFLAFVTRRVKHFSLLEKKKSGKILDERFQMNLLLILCKERMKKKKKKEN